MPNAPATAVRLQKYLADAGVCSRRAAEVLIAQGEVLVNGQTASIGMKVVPGTDKVTVSGQPVRARRQESVTLAVHKPRGMSCAVHDHGDAPTVFDLVPTPFRKLRLFCPAWLDKESEGLVILTTDGELANRLMHPSGLVVKHYRASLNRPMSREDLPALMRGVVFDDERLQVERAGLVGRGHVGASTEVDLETHQSRKRDIRQLFLALGHPVKRLRRYQIGRLSVRGFPLRAVKVLTDSEIAALLIVPQP
jgi:23S rRNA pseudouridine2605 synthase